jgi:hypothetical protein
LAGQLQAPGVQLSKPAIVRLRRLIQVTLMTLEQRFQRELLQCSNWHCLSRLQS